MSDVITLIGSSVATIERAMSSQKSSKVAPKNADAGTSFLLS